jgi:hypothetical protein
MRERENAKPPGTRERETPGAEDAGTRERRRENGEAGPLKPRFGVGVHRKSPLRLVA